MEKLKKYILARIEYEQTNSPSAYKEIISLREFFLDNSRPKVFNPYADNSEVVRIETDFELMVSSMEEAGILGAKKMTIFEFYMRIQHFDNKYKKQKQTL